MWQYLGPFHSILPRWNHIRFSWLARGTDRSPIPLLLLSLGVSHAIWNIYNNLIFYSTIYWIHDMRLWFIFSTFLETSWLVNIINTHSDHESPAGLSGGSSLQLKLQRWTRIQLQGRHVLVSQYTKLSKGAILLPSMFHKRAVCISLARATVSVLLRWAFLNRSHVHIGNDWVSKKSESQSSRLDPHRTHRNRLTPALGT